MTKKMILNASFYFKTSLEILSKIIFTALIFNWLFWKATDYYSLIAFTAEQLMNIFEKQVYFCGCAEIRSCFGNALHQGRHVGS